MIGSTRVSVYLLTGLALLAATGAAEEPAGAGYGIEVEIAPDPAMADAYDARAVITDLATGEVLSAPRVKFLRGPEGRGQIRSGVAGGRSVSMEVEVDAAGETATYRAEIREGERLVSVHRVRVSLGEREAVQ